MPAAAHGPTGYLLAAGLAAFALATVALSPFLVPARPGGVTGVIFLQLPLEGPVELVALAPDPAARIVNTLWHGHLVFVVTDAPDYGRKIRNRGALWTFGAADAACTPR